MTAFPKLPQPVAPEGSFVVPATLDQAGGSAAVSRAVSEGFLRPFDIARAEVDAAVLLYVPFWRVEVSVDGFHVGLSSMTSGGRTIPIPTGGARHKDAVVIVCARTLFPYEAKLSTVFGSVAETPPLEIGASELVARPNAEAALARGEVVDADVEGAKAIQIASAMVVRAVSPNQAIYAKYEPQVRGSTFCLYPLYYARYRYEGEARRHPGESFFVAVSGVTGALVSDHHPSAVRAVAAKVRRLLSFDRR